ncbi:5062_t:CDS:2, partial [Entrophospora sp. SA101]
IRNSKRGVLRGEKEAGEVEIGGKKGEKAALSSMINPDDKFISFPDGVNIFGSKGFGSAFIICECYKDLWKLITEDKNYNGWIVTGNQPY